MAKRKRGLNGASTGNQVIAAARAELQPQDGRSDCQVHHPSGPPTSTRAILHLRTGPLNFSSPVNHASPNGKSSKCLGSIGPPKRRKHHRRKASPLALIDSDMGALAGSATRKELQDSLYSVDFSGRVTCLDLAPATQSLDGKHFGAVVQGT